MLKDQRESRRIRASAGYRWGLAFLLIGVFLASVALPASGTAETREKKAFAHHMGSLNAGRGAMAWHTRNPELGDPAISNGGDYRTVPLVPYDLPEMTLEESADFQIRQALRIGIDGFAVNAWAGGEDAQEFLAALFKVAEEKDYPFEISICPDPNTVDQPNGLTQAWADAIKYLLDRHGDSPKLARRDGKPIIFGYQSVFVWVEYLKKKYNGDQELVDQARTTPEGWALVGEAYDHLAGLVGQPLYYQFDMGAFFHGLEVRWAPEDGVTKAAEVIARQMPAVYEFLPSLDTPSIASAAVAAGCEWGQPIFLNYDNPRTPATFGGPGTDTLRNLWAEARELNSTLLQLSTWNDFHENTNIAPGTNTNYAYFDLTGYFIKWWKTGQQPEPDRDRMYVFSRKYPRWVNMYPFQNREGSDGVIEVVTILPEPARVNLPGRGEYEAPAGYFYQQFPVTAGLVRAELIREHKIQLVVDSPEPISDRPFRQDNGITGSCSEDAYHWREDFGDMPQYRYSEYGDIDGDGLPNWFEMYWFGHFGDLSTATGTDPGQDINGDGYTNLEAYLLQRSPVAPPGSEPEPTAREPLGEAPQPIPGRIEAEHFDRGGPAVAYFDTTATNEGGEFRPEEHVGIQVTADAGSGYNVGWMASGEWLKYTVTVEAPGTYELRARVARQDNGEGQLRFFFDGRDVSGAVAIPSTGGWQEWQTVIVPHVSLKEGTQTLQVAVGAGWLNLNYIDLLIQEVNYPPGASIISPAADSIFTEGDLIEILVEAFDLDGEIARVDYFADGSRIGETQEEPYELATALLGQGSHLLTAIATDNGGTSASSEPVRIEIRAKRRPFHQTAIALPGRVRAKDYDVGGQGVSYHDSTDLNEGGGYRPDERVDLEATGDVGGGYNLGWTAPGEWLLYTVDVAQTGTYELAIRVATIASNTSFMIEFDDAIPVRINVPNTGGWQNWATVTVPEVALRQGVQTMRLFAETGDFNINYVEAESIGSVTSLTYEKWLETRFSPEEIADASISGESADPNGDGVPNLLAYALDWDSRATRKNLPSFGKVTIDGSTYLTFTYARPTGISDLLYRVEVSSDLTTWASGPDNIVVVSKTLENGKDVVVTRDAQPLRLAKNRQMRLRVERVGIDIL